MNYDAISPLDGAPGAPAQTESLAVMGRNDGATAAPLRPVLTYGVPECDRAFFLKRLPHDAQRSILRWLSAFRMIHESDNKTAATRRAVAYLSETGRHLAERTVCNRYYEFAATGSWEAAWDKRKWPDPRGREETRLPAEFVQAVCTLAENNQRGTRRAIEEVLHIWRTRHTLNRIEWGGRMIEAGTRVHSIPGYATWPEAATVGGRLMDHPAGWHESTIYRHLRMDNFAKAASRIGRAAASQHGLKVLTSRVGLKLCEFVEFDDHEFNVKVIYPGQRVFLRPRGFFAIDVLSASCFARGMKPTLWDASLEKKEALTEADFKWFVLHVLTEFGTRKDGTKFVWERGTATVRDEEFLTRLSDIARVTIDRGGKFQRAGHIGQLPAARPGFGKGNYRFKALVEGFFNLVDNAFASMPGQVGLDRNRTPEQLNQIEAECGALMKAIECGALAVANADRVKWPMLPWGEFFFRAEAMLEAIDKRRNHELEGWEKLNFITEPMLNSRGEIVVSSRRMSPAEVFAAHRGELKRLQMFELPALLGPEHCYRSCGADTVQVRNGLIEITARELTGDGDAIYFRAVDYAGDRLPNGERFRAYLNPFNTAVLVVCDAQNRVLGECPRHLLPSRNDLEGVRRAMGAKAEWFASALQDMNGRHIAAAEDIGARREHNGDLLSGRSLAAHQENERVLRGRATAETLDDIATAPRREETDPDVTRAELNEL
jgi:hypothetical protein